MRVRNYICLIVVYGVIVGMGERIVYDKLVVSINPMNPLNDFGLATLNQQIYSTKPRLLV